MANTIKIKRGLSSNIDNTTLAQGELAITTDTNELYVGVEGGKKKLGSDVVVIYDTDDESTVVKKLAEAADGPDLTGNPAKIKKECIYYETIGAPEWSRIYKLVYIASTVVDSPHTSVTFSGGYGELTIKIERGEKVNGEYQYIITKTTDSYEQTSNKIDEIGVKSYVSSSEYPSEKAVVEYVNEKVVQSNYNQNDEKAADYIKNRAIYKDGRIIYDGKVTFSDGSATITAPETLSDMLSSTPFLNEKGEFILEMVVSIGGRESSFYSNKIGLNTYHDTDELFNIYINISNSPIGPGPIWSDESEVNRLIILYDRKVAKFTAIQLIYLDNTNESDVDCKITIGVVSSVVKNYITSYNVPN